MADKLLTEGQAWDSVTRRYVDNGDGTFSPAIDSGSGGGPATIADGADVNAGSTTDAANTTGATGTMSGKLRGLLTILADVWSDASNAFRMIVADGGDVALGATTDATIITNTTGTVSGKLRGLVTIAADIWSNAANAIRVVPTSDDGTPFGVIGNPIVINDGGDVITVGGTTILVSVVPTLAVAGAYISGDAVGAVMTFSNALRNPGGVGGTGVLKSVKIADYAKQNAILDLILFRSAPTAVTDNSPFDPSDADTLKIVAAVQVSTWYSFNDNSYGQAECAIDVESDTADLYGVLVSRGTPTYATGDLQVTIGDLAD